MAERKVRRERRERLKERERERRENPNNFLSLNLWLTLNHGC
jgi:hypothetical protein